MEPRLRSEEPGLVSAQLPKKEKSKARTSGPEDVQRGNKMSAHDLDKLIKIENGLLSFNGPLPYFLYAPIKAMKWEKFFMSEIKVRLDIIDMFYAAKFNPDESYTIVEGKKVSFAT